ncbi:CPBP family intramembrane glutamic endopeptidase [Lachnoclostridium phytofermentans]|uniref:Abortive infection protein n=1 Tax=Lachnoclostridium phytofermentans (strain ATCC 700394 / DSM 18823 / ISDg) TaxID=357809 RepID=A9KJQ5_LACP7|nr:CPBP family intramembrane glutamic endopeptidase [Lachnoclostridium phytofermentans]ABX41060.1 Abortive infection protein [Lachnoclostridium phytofermentans ISDg]
MKESFIQKHPYFSVILVGLLCVFFTGIGTAIPQLIGLDINEQIVVTTVFLIISIAIGIIIMRKTRFTLSDYGFQLSKKDTNHKVWWYIPLLAVEILPIVLAGFSSEVSVLQYFILLFFTVAVGFNEEIYFRGLALKFMEGKGRKTAIIGSSIVFGVLHLANVFNGKSTLYLVLQLFFAFLVGFVFAEIVSITKSLWAVIFWHAAHDYISSITGDALDKTALIILAIQVGILLTYAIFLWKIINTDDIPKPVKK